MSIESLLLTREKLRALCAEYAKTVAWLLIASPLGAPTPDTIALIALFDNEATARDYERASLLPEDERGVEVDGIARVYRSDSLLFNFSRGVIDLQHPESPEGQVRDMVGSLSHPLRFDGLETLPRNPWVEGMTVTIEAQPGGQPPPEGAPAAAQRPLLRAFLVQALNHFIAVEQHVDGYFVIGIRTHEGGLALVLDDAADQAQAESKAHKIRRAMAEGLRPMRAMRSTAARITTPDELEALAAQASSLSLRLAERDEEGKVRLAGDEADEIREVLDIDLVGLIDVLLQQGAGTGEATGSDLPTASAPPPLAQLQPRNFHSLLAMVSVDLPIELIEAMPTDRRDAAFAWAAATHARASDNDVEVPPMPAFLAPFFRVSPGLPLGWKTGDPRPPEDLDTCSDATLLRACAVAALRRAELAPASGGAVLWLATLEDIAHALEHSDLDVIDFIAIRTNLLRLFAANAPAPAALHLHEADHIVWRLEEIVHTRAPFENMAPDALRIAAAMYLRRTYYPQEEISGIWAGCGSVFPDFSEPGARSIHEMHQRLAADLTLEPPALVSMSAGLDALRPVLDEARHHVVVSLRLAQVALRHLHRLLSTT